MKMKRNVIILILSVIFIAVSFLYIDTPLEKGRHQAHSSTLVKDVASSDSMERVVYRDKDGEITFASDLGYAIMVRKHTQSEATEEYYDETGRPVARSLGYYALQREYNEAGQNVRTICLGADHQPVNTKQGYAIIEYLYESSGETITEIYFDKEKAPVCTKNYGYSKKSEYRNGKAVRITFMDRNRDPMKTASGYAILSRTYFTDDGAEGGRSEKEFYFDEKGNPTAIDLGQYGICTEYNRIGQVSKQTYLDAEGMPMVNKRGYSSVVRTYNADNTVATELYYDSYDKPVRRSEGQYGTAYHNGQEDYLNADGSGQFNLKRFLYNQSYSAICLALLLVAISAASNRKVNAFLLILCILSIIYLTLLFRNAGKKDASMIPFRLYRQLFTNAGIRSDILRNIWLFVPLGSVLFRVYPKKRVLVIPVAVSMLVEIIQLLEGTGYCEPDDVISNSMGAVIGYHMEEALTAVINRIRTSRKKTCQFLQTTDP